MALDVLVSGGGLKLLASLLLAENVYLRGLEDASGSSSYKALPAILGPAVLFEAIFYPSRAAMMNGPLNITQRGGCPSDASTYSEVIAGIDIHHSAAQNSTVSQAIKVTVSVDICK